MYQSTLLLCLVSFSCAKLLQNAEIVNYDNHNSNGKKNNSKLWVLTLNSDQLEFNKLYLANQKEEKVFRKIISPAIENYRTQNSPRIKDERQTEALKGQESDEHNDGLKNLKNKIRVLINKFFVMHINDPESYLVDDSNGQPQLKIYFKGSYTSLILTSGKIRYQYFVNPPSPFPSWFYENHIVKDRDGYVDIPKDIQEKFLNNLLYVLNMYLSFPI